MALFTHEITVTFGDCDPAGIVFYPNFYRWMDAAFHGFLRAHAGGHQTICAALGARGLGLMESSMVFRAPARDQDRLTYTIASIDWAERSFAIAYEAHIGDRLALLGRERRGVFVADNGDIRAAAVAPLRALLAAEQ